MEVLMRRTAMLLACLLVAGPAMAQSLQLAEQKIKAGMVYNFLKYTDWPAVDGAAPMRVCLYGGDPFDGNLQPMQGRSVNQRPIVLQHIKDASEAASCQMLILDSARNGDWPELRTALTGKPVLTVSDSEDFTDAGGMIAFSHRDNRIQVLLSMDAVNAAQLHVEERLLNLVTLTRSQ
jgi:hypothetical protein